MNFKRTLLMTTMGITTVLGGSFSVQAASVSYTSSTYSGVTPYNTNLDVLKFDTSLGTLTGITITVSAEATASLDIFNNTNNAMSFTNASSSSDVTVSTTAGSATSVTVTAATTGVSDTAQPGMNSFPGPSSGVVNSAPAIISPADFSLYEGNGSNTIALNVDASAGHYSGTGASGLFFGGSTTVASNVTITYEYRPVAVPEPTTGAMFGIGVVLAVGLGWGRRRRELKKLAA